MKSQYESAVNFIKKVKPHFTYIDLIEDENVSETGYAVDFDNDLPQNLILTNLIKALGFVTVHVSCGWHGDNYKKENIFVMTKEEYISLLDGQEK